MSARATTLSTEARGFFRTRRKTQPPPAVPVIDSDPVNDLHLLRRATYGPTQAAQAAMAKLGRKAWLEQQLNPASLPDPDGDAVTALYPELALSTSAAKGTYTDFSGDLMYAMVGNTIGRSVWSSRQLHELMVAFWNDHLHIAGMYWDAWDSRHRYDLDVIRKHALGSFAEMLQAAMRQPAMLIYLDQNNSQKNKLNENLGRELLELHSVGVGNYTEADVLASSRMLTGLSYGIDREFLYRNDFHYVGALTIQGQTFPNASADGQAALTDYLNFLARHPRTAARIARKLAVRFVSDNPSQALVDELARLYLSNDTKIAPMLRHLFTCAEFTAAAGSKLKTPQEDIYAQLRSFGLARPTATTELKQLYWSLTTTGHGPMDWAPPNGFPDLAAHWSTPTTVLAKFTLHMDFSGNYWPKFSGYPKINGAESLAGLLPTPLPATYSDLVQALARRLLFTEISTTSRDAILGFFGVSAAAPAKAPQQWQLAQLVALLFDTPEHAKR